ncbi:MAG TPA: transposase [Spirochaetia bacterium]|nr:transposase [Spirochaetia bacterium]
MRVIFRHCAGVDVHRNTLMATVSHHPPEVPKPKMLTRTFEAFTDDLTALREWLLAERVTHVALKATCSYWKPAFNILEDTFTTWVINPVLLKALPGRRTGVEDSAWLAELLQQGLLCASLMPKNVQRELRDLVRYRKSLMDERAREIARIQKVLRMTNNKLGSVISDLLGVSWRTMVPAFLQGQCDPHQPVETADPKVRGSVDSVPRTLPDGIADSRCRLLAKQLGHLAYLDREIETLDEELSAQTRPFREARKLL